MRMTIEQYKQRFPDRPDPIPQMYLGQWIAWDESRQKIIAHGESLSDVASQARDAGVEDPIMQKIPSATFVGCGGA